jgi:hypothetical protein
MSFAHLLRRVTLSALLALTLAFGGGGFLPSVQCPGSVSTSC